MDTDSVLGINRGSGKTIDEISSRYLIDPSSEADDGAIANETVPEYEADSAFDAQSVGQHNHDEINSKGIRFASVVGLITNNIVTPSYVPKGIAAQIKIYDQPDNDRIYIYDQMAKKWKWFQLISQELKITQLTLPSATSGARGWTNSGSGETVVETADGADMSSSGSSYYFVNKLLAGAGFLDFTNIKTVKFEVVIRQKFNAAGVENSFGLCASATPSATDLNDETSVTRAIKFVTKANSLYAVVADGSTNNNFLIPSFSMGVIQHDLKFVWNPGVVQFFVDGVLATTLSLNVPTTSGAFPFFSGVGSSNGVQASFPSYSIAV